MSQILLNNIFVGSIVVLLIIILVVALLQLAINAGNNRTKIMIQKLKVEEQKLIRDNILNKRSKDSI
jgi:hypothetical protein